MPKPTRAQLRSMIEEATVDCYNDSEQLTGLLTSIEEHLGLPFTTEILGTEVTVSGVDLCADSYLVAVCKRGRSRQTIPLLERPLPTPRPVGATWIDAYRLWAA